MESPKYAHCYFSAAAVILSAWLLCWWERILLFSRRMERCLQVNGWCPSHSFQVQDAWSQFLCEKERVIGKSCRWEMLVFFSFAVGQTQVLPSGVFKKLKIVRWTSVNTLDCLQTLDVDDWLLTARIWNLGVSVDFGPSLLSSQVGETWHSWY